MRTELCQFSGFKIYPGHGKKYVRIDSKSFFFINAKNEKTFKRKVNPRKVQWTQIYRRVHKKGTTQEIQKKKTRRVVKVQRDIVGATMEQIRQKRAQKPEIRAASREAALREIKDRKQKKAAGAKKPAVAGKAVKQQQPKNVKKAAASKPATKGR